MSAIDEGLLLSLMFVCSIWFCILCVYFCLILCGIKEMGEEAAARDASKRHKRNGSYSRFVVIWIWYTRTLWFSRLLLLRNWSSVSIWFSDYSHSHDGGEWRIPPNFGIYGFEVVSPSSISLFLWHPLCFFSESNNYSQSTKKSTPVAYNSLFGRLVTSWFANC